MEVDKKHFIAVSYGLRCTSATIFLLILYTLPCQAAVSINLPLDDPAYGLFDKLINRGLTFRNALTIKPITRLYAAHLLAESLRQRRREWEHARRQDRFLDQTLQHLAGRFKRELRELGAFYQPRRPDPVYWSPLHEVKLDAVLAHDPVSHRVSSSRQSVQAAKLLGGRLRSTSWGTFWDRLAVYIEPELIVRTNPGLQEGRLDASLHQGYLKVGYANLELAFGRDALWWGPSAFGDIALSRDAPTFDLLKIGAPLPFRLPGAFRHLGAWHLAAFAAHLGRSREMEPTVLSGLRITLQPASYLQIGYSHLAPFPGQSGDHVPTGSPVAVDVVLSLPFLRMPPLLHGAKLYWQQGVHDRHGERGIETHGHLVGGAIDGGRWDIQFEYAAARDEAGFGFPYKRLFRGHPLSDAAESYRGRIRYFVTPSDWIAVDGHYERYGRQRPTGATTQQRIGLEMSQQLKVWEQAFKWRGRLEYARLEFPSSDPHQALYISMTVSIRRK